MKVGVVYLYHLKQVLAWGVNQAWGEVLWYLYRIAGYFPDW